jgi:5,10-methylenetetrahydromethanopterin reductase
MFDLREVARWAQSAEMAGFDFASVGDNPVRMKDTFVALAVTASATTSCRIGTAMTNFVHRDVLTVATAASSVATMAPGRVVLGIASGRVGRPQRLEDVRRGIDALRILWAGGTVEIQGTPAHLEWEAPRVPIMIGASGPRAMRLAGEVADGVIIETGLTPGAVAEAKRHVTEGARAAKRDVDGVECWWYVRAAIADTADEARDAALADVIASGALVLGSAPEERGVPKRFWAACRRLRATFDRVSYHLPGMTNPNRHLVSDPDFLSYLFDRFGVVGSSFDWRDRITELHDRGVDRIFIVTHVPDLNSLIERVGTEVLPLVEGGGSRGDAPHGHTVIRDDAL